MTNLIKKLVLLSLLIGVMYSCKKEDQDGKGDVTVKLTDAPFPFSFVSEANIGIAKIELKNTNGDYVVVFEATGDVNASYNLLEYTNGVTASLGTSTIETGTYTHAKVTLASASVALNGSIADGEDENTVFNFDSDLTGSYEIAIEPQLEVEEGEQSNVLFDIDVNETFSFTNIGILPSGWFDVITQIFGCTFEPSIRVCDLDKTGKVTGTISNDGVNVANAFIEITTNGDVITTHSKEDGTFTFIGIAEGSYEVEVSIVGEETQRHNVTVSGTGTATIDFNF